MKVLVTGATGRLGVYVLREASGRGLDVAAWGQRPHPRLWGCEVDSFDICDPALMRARFERARPDAVIHCAALSDVMTCHGDPRAAEALNHLASAHLAEMCHGAGCRMVAVSTDMVFDGERAPYTEDDIPEPRCVYGETKRRGEVAVLRWPTLAVARMSLMYGPSLTRRQSFFDDMVAHLRTGQPLRLFEDEWRAPLSLRIAAGTLLDLAEQGARGILHVGGERMSRWELGAAVASALGVREARIDRGRRAEFTGPEPRQRDLTMRCERVRVALPGWTAGDFENEVRAMLEAASPDRGIMGG